MARQRAALTSPTISFPRPRGDGPCVLGSPGEWRWFSPPTRGWPELDGVAFAGESVFPAHAGMARKRHPRNLRLCRFPRPRGDGPGVYTIEANTGKFSPPTRGWPADPPVYGISVLVFPAHAGMARASALTPSWSFSFPRPRGDGPPYTLAIQYLTRFSPPTRGWPGIRRRIGSRSIVFPAHAGMARTGTAPPPTSLCFPRPRGDGPTMPPLSPTMRRFSPPTRGWPAMTPQYRHHLIVFPAHAGMARSCGRSPAFFACFPRPRGDGPRTPGPVSLSSMFSPPTRGWPAKSAELAAFYTVFPAHAGMARCCWWWPGIPSRFPRPRGDGPQDGEVFECFYSFSPPTRGWPVPSPTACVTRIVFPAHAGMARPSRLGRGTGKSFPRPRGDGPERDHEREAAIWFSPPTRGWPVLHGIATDERDVFPAHAGMARTVRRIRTSLRRFPRPRGDGPFVRAGRRSRPLFSQRTRGWPVDGGLAVGSGGVFPAHAGMAEVAAVRAANRERVLPWTAEELSGKGKGK